MRKCWIYVHREYNMTSEIEYKDIEIKTIDNRVFRYEKGTMLKFDNELIINYRTEDDMKMKIYKEIRFNINHVVVYSYTYAWQK